MIRPAETMNQRRTTMERLSKAERHWRHWVRMNNSSHSRYMRMIDVWRRMFKVWPRGYLIDGNNGRLNFEKSTCRTISRSYTYSV